MTSVFSVSVLESMFATVWQTSIQASVLIGLVLGLIFIFRKLSPSWRILLAVIIFVRLIVPFAPESRFSIFNLWEEKTNFTKQQGMFDEPTLLVRFKEVAKLQPLTQQARDGAKQQGTFDEPTLLVREMPVLEKSLFQISWLSVGAAIWFGGLVLILGVAVIRQVRLNRGLKRSIETWSDEQALCFAQLGMQRRKPLPVFESSMMSGPAIAGLLRPRLILPANFATVYSESECHAILLHELVHLKRGDLLWNGLTFFVAALHWMNPLVWIVARGLRRNLELACDATVLRKMKSEERPNYGRALLRVAEMVTNPAGRMTVLAAPFFNENSNLKDRIQMIVNPKKTSKLGMLAMAGVVATLCLGTFTSATADDETDKKPERAQVKSERVTVTSGTKRLLETAERLEKLGLTREAAEYRAKAGGKVALKERDGDRPEQRRDVPRDRPEMDREVDRDRPAERTAVENRGRRDVAPERGRDGDKEFLERLRRLEAENRELRALVERLLKGRD